MIKTLRGKWELQIVCLLLAVILWFVIINEQNPTSEGSYTVPVTVENLAPQYIMANVPKTIYVRLSGPRNTIINVGADDIKAYVDLADATEGEKTVPIHVQLPDGTELKKQSITTADIIVDLYAVKEFRLVPHMMGALSEGMTASGVQIVPDKVVVSGAQRLLKDVDRAVIDIPLGDKDSDFSVMAPIHLVRADGVPVEGLNLTPHHSNVKVTMSGNAVTKKVTLNVPVYGNTDPAVRLGKVTVEPKTVTLHGSADLLSGINVLNLTPINIEGLAADKEWKVSVPVSAAGITAEPDLISVKVEVVPAE